MKEGQLPFWGEAGEATLSLRDHCLTPRTCASQPNSEQKGKEHHPVPLVINTILPVWPATHRDPLAHRAICCEYRASPSPPGLSLQPGFELVPLPAALFASSQEGILNLCLAAIPGHSSQLVVNSIWPIIAVNVIRVQQPLIPYEAVYTGIYCRS